MQLAHISLPVGFATEPHRNHTSYQHALFLVVLEDMAIRAMTVEKFLRGSKPKVEGSLHLNDFFLKILLIVLYSSSLSSRLLGDQGNVTIRGPTHL